MDEFINRVLGTVNFIIFSGCQAHLIPSNSDIQLKKSLLYITALCGSKKYPHTPHERSLEIPRGSGILRKNQIEYRIFLQDNPSVQQHCYQRGPANY